MFGSAYDGKANLMNASGMPLEAEKVYQKAILSGLKSVEVFMNYGFLCQDLKKFDEAAEQFKAIISMDSMNAAAFVNLGETYQMAGKNELIEQTFKKALQFHQDYATPYALNGLGVFYLSEGRFKESEEYINNAINMYPDFPDSYRNLGELYLKTSRKNQSKTLFEKTLAINPEDAKSYFLLAVMAASDHQIDQAFQAMEQALNKNYKNLEDWNSNEDLKVLHQDQRWKTLLKKHLPNQFKD
jgi:Tfp pilus assembly protein PilF